MPHSPPRCCSLQRVLRVTLFLATLPLFIPLSFLCIILFQITRLIDNLLVVVLRMPSHSSPIRDICLLWAIRKIGFGGLCALWAYQCWATGLPHEYLPRQQLSTSQLVIREWLRQLLHDMRSSGETSFSSTNPSTIYAPRLDVRASLLPDTVDLVLDSHANDASPACAVLGPGPNSLRHVIDDAILQDLRSTPFAEQALSQDYERPAFFMHGWHAPLELDDLDSELWTSLPSVRFWPSAYCFANRVSIGPSP